GLGAYTFGRTVLQVTGPFGLALVAVTLALIAAGVVFLRSHEAELEARAEQALPGPLRPVHRSKTHRQTYQTRNAGRSTTRVTSTSSQTLASRRRQSWGERYGEGR